MEKDIKLFYLTYGTLAALIILRIVPFLFPEARLWGFNYFIFLPVTYLYIFAILAVMALILPFPGFSNALSTAFIDRGNRLFFESDKKHLNRSLFILSMLGLFIIFLMPTHFMGDGYALIGNLSSQTGTFYKWSEKGITTVLTFIQSLIGDKNEYTALWSFRFISVLSGVLTLVFFFLIANILTENRVRRLLLLISMLLSGSILLFFGYVENYPLLWVAFTGFLYFGVSRLKRGHGIWLPFLFLLLGIFIHLHAIVLLPALTYLLFGEGKGLVFYRKWKKSVWAGLFILSLFGLIYFIHKYTSDLYFENIFLPFTEGKLYEPGYTIFGFRHLIDIFNLFNLLSPIILILTALSILKISRFGKNNISAFVGLISVFSFLFLLVVDPKLGMPRDWDLFSLTALPLTIFMIISIDDDNMNRLKRLFPSFLVFLLIASVPFLNINLNKQHSINYFKYIIDLEKKGSLSSLVVLRDYYDRIGEDKKNDSLNMLIYERFPDEIRIKDAFKALRNRNLNQARKILATIQPNRFSSDYHNLLSSIYAFQNRLEPALAEAKKAVQLQQYKPLLLSQLGYVYARMKEYDKALQTLGRAFELQNNNFEVLNGLTNIHMMTGNLDSALAYASMMPSSDSENATGYYLLAKINALTGSLDKAETHYQQYLRMGRSDPSYINREEELRRLIRETKK